MNIRILFIASHYFYPLTVASLARLNPDCQTIVVAYDDLLQIPEIYRQYQDQCDAVMLSGSSARRVLELNCPDLDKPVSEFQVDSDALHRDILRFAMERKSLDFSRIAMDFLLPLGNCYSVADFLTIDDMPAVISKNNDWMRYEQVLQCGAESLILQRLKDLWERNAIDCVICMYSSIIPSLRELGIPFRCPFLSDAHLKRLIKDILVKIELNRLHNNHPAIIQIFPADAGNLTEEQGSVLEQELRHYLQANLVDCVIQRSEACCTVITSMQVVRFLTDEFHICQIWAMLKEKHATPFLTAYGIGTTISHAMNNVQIASREAKLQESPFVMDSNGHLIGPMNSQGTTVITQAFRLKLSDIARQSSLSVTNVQKILAVLHNRGSDKLTTQELAESLNTTVRNASRIMQNLIQGGFAVPVFTQASHSRGRPVQVYSINLNISL